MRALSMDDLAADAARFDEDVLATSGIDHFCSSTDWVLPAHATLMPARRPWVYRGTHGWLALALGVNGRGWTYLQPLEAAWGLACPIIGADVDALCADLAALCRAEEAAWDFMLLSGVPVDSLLAAALVRELGRRYEIRLGVPTRRHVASLEGGVDGFLARRSRSFRKSLRRAERLALADGIQVVPAHTRDPAAADAAFARLLEVERRSWKGQEGVGVDHGDMCEFYRRMNQRLAARGAQRLWFVRAGERDVGYVFGGVLGDTYRGLQFSFDADYARYSIGSLAQLAQIRELCAEGYARYDLGTDIAYKQRWGEQVMETALLIVTRRR